MNWWHFRDRKGIGTALGTVGLGLGLIVAIASGVSDAEAQETSTPGVAQDESGSGEGEALGRPRLGEMRAELYAEFTAALADELGIGSADEVDAAIRVAMMSLVDTRVDDGLLTAGQGEALKVLIATSDAPLGPGPVFGPPRGPFLRVGPNFGERDRFFPILGAREGWVVRDGDGSPAHEGEDRDVESPANDADSDPDDAGAGSS